MVTRASHYSLLLLCTDDSARAKPESRFVHVELDLWQNTSRRCSLYVFVLRQACFFFDLRSNLMDLHGSRIDFHRFRSISIDFNRFLSLSDEIRQGYDRNRLKSTEIDRNPWKPIRSLVHYQLGARNKAEF